MTEEERFSTITITKKQKMPIHLPPTLRLEVGVFSAKKIKVAIGGAALVMAEVLFWLGALLVGKETIQKYTKRLFKRKRIDFR
jgi:hypothetical protein